MPLQWSYIRFGWCIDAHFFVWIVLLFMIFDFTFCLTCWICTIFLFDISLGATSRFSFNLILIFFYFFFIRLLCSPWSLLSHTNNTHHCIYKFNLFWCCCCCVFNHILLFVFFFSYFTALLSIRDRRYTQTCTHSHSLSNHFDKKQQLLLTDFSLKIQQNNVMRWDPRSM